MSERSSLVTVLTASSVLVAGLLVPVTILNERSEGDGYLWAWADAATDSLLALLLVAALGCLCIVAVQTPWFRRRINPPDLASTILVVASGFGFGAFVALLIAKPLPEYNLGLGIAVVLIAIALLGLSIILPPGAGFVLHLASTGLLAVTVSRASAYVDNSERPVAFALALAILLAPIVAIAANHLKHVGPVLAIGILGTHLFTLIPVIVAAVACDDDDCIPAPPWLVAVTLVSLWSLAARLSGAGAPSDSILESDNLFTVGPRVLTSAALPLVVLAAGFGVAASVDFDAQPAELASTPASIESSLPGMIGWTSASPCREQGATTSSTVSNTATIAGSGLASSERLEVCFSSFRWWSVPGPSASIEQYGRPFLLDPMSATMTELVTHHAVDQIEPQVAPVRYEYDGRGIHQFWSARGDAEFMLFEVRAGRDYHVRSMGFSDDGTWMFVVDSFERLIVMPVDGSSAPTVLDAHVRDASSVMWGPGASFEPYATVRLTNPGDTTYVPDGTDMNEARTMISAQARLFGDEALVEFVVVDDRVYGRFLGLPNLDQTERGLCVRLTTWLSPASSDRLGVTAVVGDGGMSCIPEAESSGYRCGNILTLPTVATVDQLTGAIPLGMRASLLIPITFPSDPKPFTGLRRQSDDWSLGPITSDDLPHLTIHDISCGPQPNQAESTNEHQPSNAGAGDEPPTAADEGTGEIGPSDNATAVPPMTNRDELIAVLEAAPSREFYVEGGFFTGCVADLWFVATGTWDISEIETRYYQLGTGIFSMCSAAATSTAADAFDGLGDMPIALSLATVQYFELGYQVDEIRCIVAAFEDIAPDITPWRTADDHALLVEVEVAARQCVARVAGLQPDAAAPGEDDDLDQLWQSCAAGRGLDCEELKQEWSPYDQFGRNCGGRTVSVVDCAELLHGMLEANVEDASGLYDLSLISGQAGAAPGWSLVLDDLWAGCAAGNAATCDDLYSEAPISSLYEAFGATCGGRVNTDDHCEDLLAE